DDVAERRAHRDGHVEDGEGPPAGALVEEIREQRWRDGAVGRLPDSDQGARAEELQVTAREARKTGRETPEKNADRDRLRTGAAVAEPPEDRRGEQIDDEKAAHQAPELGIREPHRSLLEVR